MSKQRKQWTGRRFGNIDEKILGQINEVKDISWPDLIKEYKVKGNILEYQIRPST